MVITEKHFSLGFSIVEYFEALYGKENITVKTTKRHNEIIGDNYLHEITYDDSLPMNNKSADELSNKHYEDLVKLAKRRESI